MNNKNTQENSKMVKLISNTCFSFCAVITILTLKAFSVNMFHAIYLMPVSALIVRNVVLKYLNISVVNGVKQNF